MQNKMNYTLILTKSKHLFNNKLNPIDFSLQDKAGWVLFRKSVRFLEYIMTYYFYLTNPDKRINIS